MGAGPCGDSSHGGRAAALQSLFWLSTAEQSAPSLSLLSFSYFTRGYASSRRDVPALRRVRTQRRCCRQVQCAPYSRRNVTINMAGTLAKLWKAKRVQVMGFPDMLHLRGCLLSECLV